MHPRPLSWVGAKAAPQEARERQEGASAEPKLAVNTVRNRRRDGRVDASSVERGTMEPPISNPQSLGKPSSEQPVLRGGAEDVRKVPVGTGRGDEPAKASLIDGASDLLDRRGLRERHRSERSVRLDDRSETDVRDAGKLARAASTHLLHAFEPREAEADLLAPGGSLVAVELAPIANMRVYSIVRKAWDGSTTDVGGVEKRRRRRGFMWHARAVDKDGRKRRLGSVVGDAKAAGRDVRPLV